MPVTAKKRHFLLCISNDGCEDLEPRKVYEQLPDECAASEGCVRVIDDSGEDYVYPATCFVPVELTREAEDALSSGRGR